MEKVICEYTLAIVLKCFDEPIVLEGLSSALGIYSSFKAGAKVLTIPGMGEGCTGYINSEKITMLTLCRSCDSETVADDTCVVDGEDDESNSGT